MDMAGGFAGKAVIVTGASSGIGRVIAVELGRHGADLWLIGRSQAELEETARQVAAAGGPPARVAAMDLQRRGPLAALIAEVGAAHPHLFGLISNAGVMYPEPIMDGTVDRWQQMLDINVMAMLEGCQAAVKAMRGHGRSGHLINIGSVQARFEVPGVYGVTKQATLAIGDTLREELEQDDIRVATIVPGGFTTNLARGFLPETLAHLARGFETMGLALGGPGTERVLSDPQHIANMVRYVMEQPIELNIQEIVLRPPVSTKA
jgi:NADP-dependent 3-hydroxy acid dehydrogenase YdfG